MGARRAAGWAAKRRWRARGGARVDDGVVEGGGWTADGGWLGARWGRIVRCRLKAGT